MGKWFDDVFLPSLYDRTNAHGEIWCTAKQADICQRYMVGSSTVRGCYSAKWRGRTVSINISPQNGAGLVRFYEKDDDIARTLEELNKAHDIEWLTNEIASLGDWITQNPDTADDEDRAELDQYRAELAALTA